MTACARNGITSFHDAGASGENIELFKKFRKENKLKSRLYVMITGWDRKLIQEWYKRGPEIDPRGVTVRAIKLNCDGALGSRGAWLLEEYTDRPGIFGMATLPMDTVLKTSRDGLKYGFQVCSHAMVTVLTGRCWTVMKLRLRKIQPLLIIAFVLNMHSIFLPQIFRALESWV